MLFSLLARLDHFVLLVARHFLVMIEFLFMHATASRQRAESAGIAVELLGRDVGLDQLKAPLHVHAMNLAATAGEVAHYFAHRILGNADFDHMDGFEQAWPRGHE